MKEEEKEMEPHNQSTEPSLREQCITAYITAALVTTDARRYTPKEFAGFLLIAQANLDLTGRLKETNPRLYQRNVEAAALLAQIRSSENKDEEEDAASDQSPLAQPGEDDGQRIKRLLKEGTVRECLIEAKHWLNYYLEEEDAELEPVSTALALHERAYSLLEEEAAERKGQA